MFLILKIESLKREAIPKQKVSTIKAMKGDINKLTVDQWTKPLVRLLLVPCIYLIVQHFHQPTYKQ